MTHTGSSASSIINQKGKCVLNSVSSGPQKNPSFHCGADGKWILNSKSCQCRPGFKSNFDRTQCSREFFKAKDELKTDFHKENKYVFI